MKKLNIKIYILLICIGLASCKKFVDIGTKNGQIYLTTSMDCQLLLDHYDRMNAGYPLDGEISADDYYVSNTTYQQTAISQEERNLYTWQPNAIRSSATPNWQNPYFTIYYTNLVLERLVKLEGGKDAPEVLNNLKGSALFFRAYALWNIAQLYTKPYSAATASQDPGIPIRLSSDINDVSVRGTVQDTYNRILQDLKDAVTLLQPTSIVATRPNKAAAYAMLARTYLSMADYPNALINANAAIQLKGGLLDYNSADVNKSSITNTPFKRYNKEVIFHSVTYFNSSIAGAILVPGIASTNRARIDPALVSSYAADDLRKTVFLKPNSGVHAGSSRFTGNYEPSVAGIFFNGLAVDEMYLIRSECYARAGKLAESLTDLNSLLSNRWKTGTYTNMLVTDPATDTQNEVLTKVLEERRKELLMRGQRWTDLRRLNKEPLFKKDLERQVATGTPPNEVTTTFSLPANDPRYTLLIPQEVINNSGIAQNTR